MQSLQNVEKPHISQRIRDKILSKTEKMQKWAKTELKTLLFVLIPLPYRIFFQVHGSKFKPDPICNLSQASVKCITHGILFFCIYKYTFYCFFSFFIQFLVFWGMTNIFCHFKIIIPDMFSYCFFTFCVIGAGIS